MDIIGSGDVPIINRTRNFKDFSKSINYFEVNSKLVPYVDPEDYLRQTAYTVEGTNSLIETDNLGRVKFTGKYGPDLLSEID